MDKYDRDEVLSRPELDMSAVDPRYFKQEGSHPHNQVEDNHGHTFIPVRYKCVPHKLRIHRKR